MFHEFSYKLRQKIHEDKMVNLMSPAAETKYAKKIIRYLLVQSPKQWGVNLLKKYGLYIFVEDV